ncbi:AbrB/MazE/SpoVT family DNA-binding domain-containing protein [Sphingomonas canadensis]|uniref:AbrB/MazE/SpoVT family DNA-binding domain-containing protein n=1 Tax=Sphingomonas canadensis TaxID=1219257 RepID=A0ABW3H3W2_9SPHN|nr:AbrB/MazE/SpoVT family DNA-binding domain-containing protein [Sphingomonas canadensis]MCW3835691.1 AbrB/MazE/SpoVT family DNA-binding domain-containing protein [Sphingomonas canadensis]
MTKEYRARTFKSGNSVALRLPKGLGIEPGREMRVREEQGRFTVEPADVKRKIDVSKFWGKAPGLTVPSRDDFDDPPRAWDRPGWPGWPDSSTPE